MLSTTTKLRSSTVLSFNLLSSKTFCFASASILSGQGSTKQQREHQVTVRFLTLLIKGSLKVKLPCCGSLECHRTGVPQQRDVKAKGCQSKRGVKAKGCQSKGMSQQWDVKAK
jgi:hypothetical protein